MSLYSRIEKQVEETVKSFCKTLADKYEGLDEEELMKIWVEHAKTKTKKSGTLKKKSAYHIFNKMMCAKLKKEQPHLSFGDRAKVISSQWNQMSAEEKQKYAETIAVKNLTPQKNPESLPDISTTVETKTSSTPLDTLKTNSPSKKTKEKKVVSSPVVPAYEEMKIAELKKLCKERGVFAKGMTKKSEFVDMLQKLDNASQLPSSVENEHEESDNESTFSQLLEEEEEKLLA